MNTKYIIRYRNGGLKPSCRFIFHNADGSYAVPSIEHATKFESAEAAQSFLEAQFRNAHGRLKVIDVNTALISMILES